MAVLFLQRHAVDLARPETRQRFCGKDHPRRDLEGRQLALEEVTQPGLVELAPGASVKDGDRHLPQALIGHTEDRRLRYIVTAVERGLDLGGANIFAAADDDVLFAVDDEQVAVLIEVADIS